MHDAIGTVLVVDIAPHINHLGQLFLWQPETAIKYFPPVHCTGN